MKCRESALKCRINYKVVITIRTSELKGIGCKIIRTMQISPPFCAKATTIGMKSVESYLRLHQFSHRFLNSAGCKASTAASGVQLLVQAGASVPPPPPPQFTIKAERNAADSVAYRFRCGPKLMGGPRFVAPQLIWLRVLSGHAGRRQVAESARRFSIRPHESRGKFHRCRALCRQWW